MKQVLVSELKVGDLFIDEDALYEMLPPQRIVVRGNILNWIKAKHIIGPSDTRYRPSVLPDNRYLIALSKEVLLCERVI